MAELKHKRLITTGALIAAGLLGLSIPKVPKQQDSSAEPPIPTDTTNINLRNSRINAGRYLSRDYNQNACAAGKYLSRDYKQNVCAAAVESKDSVQVGRNDPKAEISKKGGVRNTDDQRDQIKSIPQLERPKK